mmetsp:Transcript_24726/g.39244  ORF Transcript_24726/g.39244 Transcript_24726/m.39244 type:complete len:227 (+) Transcript_24726:279-959(+)
MICCIFLFLNANNTVARLSALFALLHTFSNSIKFVGTASSWNFSSFSVTDTLSISFAFKVSTFTFSDNSGLLFSSFPVCTSLVLTSNFSSNDESESLSSHSSITMRFILFSPFSSFFLSVFWSVGFFRALLRLNASFDLLYIACSLFCISIFSFLAALLLASTLSTYSKSCNAVLNIFSDFRAKPLRNHALIRDGSRSMQAVQSDSAPSKSFVFSLAIARLLYNTA